MRVCVCVRVLSVICQKCYNVWILSLPQMFRINVTLKLALIGVKMFVCITACSHFFLPAIRTAVILSPFFFAIQARFLSRMAKVGQHLRNIWNHGGPKVKSAISTS